MSKLNIKEAFFSNGEAKKVGGQAIIEGVMMRGEKKCAMAVRKTDGDIEVLELPVNSGESRPKILKLPIIRGVIMFVDSLVVGMKTLMKSAEIAGIDLEEGEPSKFEKYITEKFGEKKIMDVMIFISVGVAIALSIGLFMALPTAIGHLFNPLLGVIPGEPGTGNLWALSIIEGTIRILIFLSYIFLISKYKDIQRVFEYHGAEHKTINCFEANEELTVENVKRFTRLHKRCGTSFLFIVMLISMFVFLFVHTSSFGMRLLSRVLLVPFIAGVSYEFLKFAGKSRSRFIYVLSYPGLSLQKVTTKEPDDAQIETAILAMKKVIESEAEEAEKTEEKEGVPSLSDTT
jgi:uncharacterized protein YqhQ